MQKDGIALSYLQTGDQFPVYQKQGWFEVPLPRSYISVEISGSPSDLRRAPTAQLDGFSLRRVRAMNASDSLIDSLSELHLNFCERFQASGPLDRSDREYWRRYVDYETRRNGGSGLLVAFGADGSPCAWSVLKVKPPRVGSSRWDGKLRSGVVC